MNNDRIFNITGLLRHDNSNDDTILDRYCELEEYLFVPQNFITDILKKQFIILYMVLMILKMIRFYCIRSFFHLQKKSLVALNLVHHYLK